MYLLDYIELGQKMIPRKHQLGQKMRHHQVPTMNSGYPPEREAGGTTCLSWLCSLFCCDVYVQLAFMFLKFEFS